jgi:hypothetical protein
MTQPIGDHQRDHEKLPWLCTHQSHRGIRLAQQDAFVLVNECVHVPLVIRRTG